ncbi:MAG: S41 family peptidase [Bacillota bacterium]
MPVGRVIRGAALAVAIALCASALVVGCASDQVLEYSTANDGSTMLQPGFTLTKRQAVEDCRFFIDAMRDRYPYLELKKRTEGYDWLAHEAEFLKLVEEAKSHEEFAKAMSRIALSLNNGHTGIISGAMLQVYEESDGWASVAKKATRERADYWHSLAGKSSPPAVFPPFIASYSRGEYVVTNVAPDDAIQSQIRVGSRVVKVSGIPVHEYVKSHRGSRYLPYDPEFGRIYESPRLYFDRHSSTVSVEIIDPDGILRTVDIPWAKEVWQAPYPNCPPAYAADPGTDTALGEPLCTVIDWNGSKVGYVYLPSMDGQVHNDAAILRDFFASIRDLPAVILDIRSNSGGNDAYWRTNIISQLGLRAKHDARLGWAERRSARAADGSVGSLDKTWFADLIGPAARSVPPEIWTPEFAQPVTFPALSGPGIGELAIGYEGSVFVLTSRQVYSSAETFAATCKASGIATLVGTYTGGDGIGVMPGIVVLPNSGMVIRYPVTMGLNPDWTANEEFHTKPDVLVEQSLEDLLRWLEATGDEGFPGAPRPELDTVLRECLNLAATE